MATSNIEKQLGSDGLLLFDWIMWINLEGNSSEGSVHQRKQVLVKAYWMIPYHKISWNFFWIKGVFPSHCKTCHTLNGIVGLLSIYQQVIGLHGFLHLLTVPHTFFFPVTNSIPTMELSPWNYHNFFLPLSYQMNSTIYWILCSPWYLVFILWLLSTATGTSSKGMPKT